MWPSARWNQGPRIRNEDSQAEGELLLESCWWLLAVIVEKENSSKDRFQLRATHQHKKMVSDLTLKRNSNNSCVKASLINSEPVQNLR